MWTTIFVQVAQLRLLYLTNRTWQEAHDWPVIRQPRLLTREFICYLHCFASRAYLKSTLKASRSPADRFIVPRNSHRHAVPIFQRAKSRQFVKSRKNRTTGCVEFISVYYLRGSNSKHVHKHNRRALHRFQPRFVKVRGWVPRRESNSANERNRAAKCLSRLADIASNLGIVRGTREIQDERNLSDWSTSVTATKHETRFRGTITLDRVLKISYLVGWKRNSGFRIWANKFLIGATKRFSSNLISLLR